MTLLNLVVSIDMVHIDYSHKHLFNHILQIFINYFIQCFVKLRYNVSKSTYITNMISSLQAFSNLYVGALSFALGVVAE